MGTTISADIKELEESLSDSGQFHSPTGDTGLQGIQSVTGATSPNDPIEKIDLFHLFVGSIGITIILWFIG